MKFDLNYLQLIAKFPYVTWERLNGGDIYANPGAAVLSWCSSRNFNFTATAPNDVAKAAIECEIFASSTNLVNLVKSMKDESIAKEKYAEDVEAVSLQLHFSGHDKVDVNYHELEEDSMDLLQSIIDLHFKLTS